MKIIEIVQNIKKSCRGIAFDGNRIDEKLTRDKILFGDPTQICRGIVVTCYASIDVIKEAINQGSNLIIVHETLFWNRGDKTDWLLNNKVFLEKKELLEKNNIVVWRNHDYIHSGISTSDGYKDGIFYGIAKSLDWQDYIVGENLMPTLFEIPQISANNLAKHLIKKLGLNGLRLIGNNNAQISKVQIPLHMFGDDNDKIRFMDEENIDAIIAMELVDFSISSYVRDAGQLGLNKTIFSVGHFNLEEVGMEYMLEYIPQIIGKNIPISFVKSGDNFTYIKS
ncbi:MAG: hypothetical protein GX675_02010 [Erysipelotrichaceae bacterium]|nr:hypothetical protein [Erysipelotrichaceae bacterium]